MVAAPNSFTWTTSPGVSERGSGTGTVDATSLTIVGDGTRDFVNGTQHISVRITATPEF
jgi:hypothetical protein